MVRVLRLAGVAFSVAALGPNAARAAGASTLVVTGITTPRSAGSTGSATVEARSSSGARATNYAGTIRFTSTDGQAVLPANYTFTATDAGIHTFTNAVVLKTAGTQSVTATDTVTATITGTQTGIVVNALAVSTLSVGGISSPRTAGTASSVRVTALDVFGNQASSYRGTIHFTSTDPAAKLPADYTFTATDAGDHTFVATPSMPGGVVLNTAGSQSVTVTDVSNASLTAAQTGNTVNAAAAATLVVSGISSPRTANFASSVAVEARDSFGNRATGYAGTVHFTSSDAAAILPANYKFTATDSGLHNFTATTGGTVTLKTPGSQSVTATDTVTASVAGSQTGIQVVSNAATALVVSGFPASAAAGTNATVTVEARDAAGSRSTGYSGTVHFTTSDVRAVLPADYRFTAGTTCTPSPCDNGIHSFSVTLKTAGTQSITATDTVASTITGTQSGISIAAGPAASLNVSGFPSLVTAGVAGSATIEARDAFGNRATTYAGTVQLTATDPIATVPSPVSFAGAQGIQTVAGIIFRTAGTQSLLAADSTTPSIAGRQDGISVTPAAAAALSVNVAIPGGALTAGQSTSATITAFDAFGNVATGYVGTVHFSSSDPLATLPPDHTFLPADFGRATVAGLVFRTTGSQSFTATDTLGGLAATQTGIPVFAGAAASLVASGFPNSVTAGSAGALTVTAFDAFGNTATGYLGTVAFTSSDAQAALPAPTAFASTDAGSRTFPVTLKTAGTQSITVTDTANAALTASQTSSVAPASAASLLVSGISSPVTTGAASSVTVDARDAFGNRAPGYTGTVSFTSTDAQASLPPPYTFQAADAGLHVFTGAVVLRTSGAQSVTATDTVNAAITGTQSGISVLDGIPPTWPPGSTLTATATSSTSAHLVWTAATDNVAVTAYRLYQDGVLVQTLAATLSTDVTGLAVGVTVHFQVQAGDAAGNFTTNGPTATFATVPPDPVLVAPPIDKSVSTNAFDATSFLYTGPNPIQTGVVPGTIQPTRVAVLRGTVHDRAGQPLPAVRISIVGRPELGQTLSRADGAFDLAVNGGGLLTVRYERADLLTAQRQMTPEWQDYTTLPDVVLVPQDQLVSIIDMGSTNTQVARGSVSTDDIGTRQATVIFPPGTGAMLKMPDGSTQTVGTLHVRATELTVGPKGPAAMPGPLPPASAYTYAAAFTADEAVQAGATSVQFSQTVFGYLENFLAFPVGFVIPVGSYDTAAARWAPQANGKVVQVLSVTNGLADLDTNGDGVPDDAATLANLGVSNAELAQLAVLYQPGQTLWRVPMQHFSWDDWNVGLAIPRGSDAAPPVKPDTAKRVNCSDTVPGCVIEVENQVVTEDLPIVGTPYALHYDSGRVPGRRASYRLNVTLPAPKLMDISGATTACLPNRIPECQIVTAASPFVRAESTVYLEVAGQKVSRSTGPTDPVGVTPPLWQFEWDGKDAYGRELQGEQPVTVTYCYNYPGIGYGTQEEIIASFGQPTLTGAMVLFRFTGAFSQVFDVCSKVKTTLGGWNVKSAAMGGWTLSAQHMLDVPNRTLYRGDGGIQRVDDLNRYVVNFVAGTGHPSNFGGSVASPVSDGTPAASVNLAVPEGVVVGPDGSIYVSDSTRGIIARITPDGLYHIFAGMQLTTAGSTADGVPASQARLFFPAGLALAADGTLYFADADFGRIRKVTPDGRVFTVAGSGLLGRTGFSPDGTPALSAVLALDRRGQIAVGPDGTVYFAELANNRVRKVGPDGILRTVAGSTPVPDPTGFGGFSGDGGPALQAALSLPQGVTLGPDGSIYIADSCNQRVRKVTPDGIISTVAGSGDNCRFQNLSFGGDGGPATSAGLGFPFFSLAVAPDSTLFIADFVLASVRRVTPLGTIDTVAGNGFIGPAAPGTRIPGCAGDNCPGPATAVGQPESVAIGPGGEPYVGFASNMFRIGRLRAASAKNDVTITNILVPSSDASEVYVFDSRGRHLRTLDALTNAQLQLFSYNSAGLLASITDRNGNVTTIQRDAQGNPTAIVSPYGQQTTLTVDSDGYLHTVTNPNSELVQLLYKPVVAGDTHTGGLLTQYANARGGLSLYEYDANGFLTKDTPPDGTFVTIDRGGSLAPISVTYRTALGRTETDSISVSAAGDAETRTSRDPAGLVTTMKRNADESTSVTQPDGTSINSTITPDPRFGIQASVASTTIRTPAGLTRTVSQARGLTLSNPNDVLSVASLVDTVTVNGRTYKSSFDAVAKTVTLLTPAGRQTIGSLDSLGRVTQVQSPGVLPISIQYDARGRPQAVTQGSRTYSYAYDGLGRLQAISDPLHTITFGYDGANRATSSVLSDLTSISATYDGNGNMLSLTPPGRVAHTFSYQAGNLEQDYTPPATNGNLTGHVHTSYDPDRSLASIAPDGLAPIVPTYDAVNGRMLTLGFSAGTNSYTYAPTSGHIASITASDGNKVNYTYDGPLLLTTSFSGGPAVGTVIRTYDSDFRLATEAVNGGPSVIFQYDADSLLSAAGALSIMRAPATGFVIGTALSNVTDSRTYDSFGDEQTHTASYGATTLYSADYGTRDVLGRIVRKTETVGGEQHVYAYAYDSRNRLTDVIKDGSPLSHYTYDANGNRTAGPALTTSPVYDSQDRLLNYGNCEYSYKPDGSLQTKTCPDGVTTYDYDSFGNLRGVMLPGGTAITSPSTDRIAASRRRSMV